MNGIDKSDVQRSVNNFLQIKKGQVTPDTLGILEYRDTLNGLSDVGVKIVSWRGHYLEGSADLHVEIYKDKLYPPLGSIFKIHVQGYASISKEQHQLNSITSEDVKNIFLVKFSPGRTTPIPPNPNSFDAQIKSIIGVHFLVSKWTPIPGNGSVTFSVTISQDNLTSPSTPFDIQIDGFKPISANQKRLNDITRINVSKAMSAALGPDDQISPPASAPQAKYIIPAEELQGMTVDITNWSPDSINGSTNMTVTIEGASVGPGVDDRSFDNIHIAGYKSTQPEQQRLAATSEAQVIQVIKDRINYSHDMDAPLKPNDFDATINGVGGVTISISLWNPNNLTGVIAAEVTIKKPPLTSPGTFVISIDHFHTISDDQNNMNGIELADVQAAINTELSPSLSKDIPPIPSTFKTTIRGVVDVSVIISNWIPKFEDGTVTMDVSISKVGLQSPPAFIGILISGYNTISKPQLDLNNITPSQVATSIKSQLSPSVNKKISLSAPSPFTDSSTGITFTISDWVPSTGSGSAIMSVTLSKTGLTSPPIFHGISVTGFEREVSNQQKFDNIHATDVEGVINSKLSPSPIAAIPSTVPILGNIDINGLTRVSTSISNWSVDQANGSAKYDITLTSLGLPSRKFKKLEITGFSSNVSRQEILAYFNLINTDPLYGAGIYVDANRRNPYYLPSTNFANIISETQKMQQKFPGLHLYIFGTNGSFNSEIEVNRKIVVNSNEEDFIMDEFETGYIPPMATKYRVIKNQEFGVLSQP